MAPPRWHKGLRPRHHGKTNPLIVAFCCHYCAYAAADLAGTMRLQYPGSVRVLRLPCTGKIEVNYLLAAFERGVDGVIVAGCLEGGCHFQEGNLRARRRVERAKQMLEEIGLEPERLEMFNLSSAEGTRFAEIVTEMNERIAQLGPSPLRRNAHGSPSKHAIRGSLAREAETGHRRRNTMIVADRKKVPEIRDMIKRPRPRAPRRVRHLRHRLPGRRRARDGHSRFRPAHVAQAHRARRRRRGRVHHRAPVRGRLHRRPRAPRGRLRRHLLASAAAPAFRPSPNDSPTRPSIPASTRNSSASSNRRASGPRNAPGAARAASANSPASARSPDAPNACSTAPAPVPATANAKSAKTSTAPGNSSMIAPSALGILDTLRSDRRAAGLVHQPRRRPSKSHPRRPMYRRARPQSLNSHAVHHLG